MHSSRMRIARLLPVSPSLHCIEGVPAPGRCLLPGVCSRGGCAWSPWEGVVSQHALRQTPPPCEQNSWHMLLKILPCPNFVNKYSKQLQHSSENGVKFHFDLRGVTNREGGRAIGIWRGPYLNWTVSRKLLAFRVRCGTSNINQSEGYEFVMEFSLMLS